MKKIQKSLCAAVILAAGKGVRMKSELPKVLHRICGAPLIDWVIESVQTAGVSPICVVTGKGKEQVEKHIKSRFKGLKLCFVVQKQRKGSGHAVMRAEKFLTASKRNYCLIVCGDSPLLKKDTLRRLIEGHIHSGAQATVLSARIDNPAGYGRIIRNTEGLVTGIIEDGDASPEQRKIDEINSGVYCFSIPALLSALKKIQPNNVKREYYLTDTLHYVLQAGGMLNAVCTDDAEEVLGINNRTQLAEAEAALRHRNIILGGNTL